jgi:hypothetical protein|nr:Fe-S oxidoreductase [uncultured bacterium]
MDLAPDKKLGFGLMRLPLKAQGSASDIDIEQTEKMVDLFLSKGFTYFDTAFFYCGGASESAARKALVQRHDRKSFTLADKLHSSLFNTADGVDRVFEQQLEKTGASYFDHYLLHGVESDMLKKHEKFNTFEWLLRKKEEGLVKYAGFSYHDNAELLDEILTRYPEMEFVQIQLNYLDWESQWIQSRACYETIVRHGKRAVIMEPLKGGTLANIPEEAARLFRNCDPAMSVPSWGIRFAASLPGVMCVLSGMSSLSQMQDNTGYMEDFVPLNEAEKEVCFKVADIINAQTAVPCTACHYCTDGCPMHIAIPEFFSLYNEDMRDDLEKKGWTISNTTYRMLKERGGGPADCIACGQCQEACPQHLTVIDYLKEVAEHFEGAS